MDRQFVQNNAASRQRLHALIARFDDEAMQRIVRDDWTVSALLAHIAFWDQSCVVRWDHFDRTGSFLGLSDETIDVVNAANFPTWRALPGDAARDLALRATEQAAARLARLSDEALAYVEQSGRRIHLDRSGHRNEHVQQIEAALAMI